MAELTDIHVWELSKRITSGEELLDLGVKVLKLPEYTVNATKYNHKTEIREATHKVLTTWLKKQTTRREAYTTLQTALRECEMSFLATELQLLVEGAASLSANAQNGEITPGKLDLAAGDLSSCQTRKCAKVTSQSADAKLAKIAEKVSASDLESIALIDLGFSDPELKNIERDCRGQSVKRNREILIRWKNRSPDNTVESLVGILEATGKVDIHAVREVLGLNEPQ